MMNKRQAIGLMFIALILVAIIGLTAEQRVHARSRATEGAILGGFGGMAVGGAVGGRKGMLAGGIIGGVTGYAAGSAADDRAEGYYNDYEPWYDDEVMIVPRRTRVIYTGGEYFSNDYYGRPYRRTHYRKVRRCRN